jgi:hypothetical protein
MFPRPIPSDWPIGLACKITNGRSSRAALQSDGAVAFDFSLKVKLGVARARPVFSGRLASGPSDDRFVYLSWWAIERGDWINRVKARLSTIDWEMILASQEQRRRITADLTGWAPGDRRKFVTWYLG